MATNTRVMRCVPHAVFQALSDAWLYPAWVVGAARMRDVEADWPAERSKLHHSVGIWPFLINGTTSMLEWDPPRRAVMQARGWPLGEARVTIEAQATRDGCRVTIDEVAVRGAGAAVPRIFTDPVLRWRNNETLRRLSYLAENGAGGPRGPISPAAS